MAASPTVDDLLSQYVAVLNEMHQHRVELGGKPRIWNRLVHEAQKLHLALRESVEGRAAITALVFEGENSPIRDWSACNALAWDASRVRPYLESRATDPDLGAVAAKWTPL